MLEDKEIILQELEELPDTFLDEVLDFVRFLKAKHAKAMLETVLLSEAVLGRDWLRPEEDEAWGDL
jgi:hypothetical protein